MQVKLASVFVDDQDEARRIYTEPLRFEVKTTSTSATAPGGSSSCLAKTPTAPNCCSSRPTSRRPVFQEHLRNLTNLDQEPSVRGAALGAASNFGATPRTDDELWPSFPSIYL